MAAQFANAGAAAPAHQYASRFLRAARPIARPGAGEHARAARGPVAPRAQRQWPIIVAKAPLSFFMVQWADLSREIDYYRLEAPARAV